MTILLSGEELELYFDFGRMDKIEKTVGSLYGFIEKCNEKKVTFLDIVTIYYYAQNKSAYSKEDLFNRVMKDGLSTHTNQCIEAIVQLIVGEEAFKTVQEDLPEKK